MIRLKYLLSLCLLLCLAPGLSADTDTGSGLFGEASALLAKGNPLEAASRYRHMLESSPDREQRAKALLFLATLYSHDLNLPDNAVACLKEIETSYPDTSAATDARFALGVVTYRSGRFREAITYFERFIARHPDHMRSSSARTWLAEAEEIVGEGRLPEVPGKAMAQLPDRVRVLIRKGVTKVLLGKADEPIAILRDGATLFEGRGPVTVTAGKGGLCLNGGVAGNKPLTVAAGETLPRVDGRAYRGALTLWPEGKTIQVVNTLDVESYLYGVLPREMSPRWPEEALKAQAVASRTYTYHNLLGRMAHPRFDMESTTAFQVYGGADAETPSTTRPVDLTRGLYLAFQGLPIVACFHANSGGVTESADAVWGASLPYLQGVTDSFSQLAPETCWKAELEGDTMAKRLVEKGHRPGRILSLETANPTASGRNGRVIIATSRGPIELSGNAFRLTMGPSIIKSARFTTTQKGTRFFFEGCGYGHGVGMSQWGAQKMAASGFTYDTILHHYYKDVSLVAIDKEPRR